jgi:hypothetical protein
LEEDMRAKIVVSVEINYEIDLKNYPEDTSYQEALDLDIDSANRDPWMFLELEGVNISVKGGLQDENS